MPDYLVGRADGILGCDQPYRDNGLVASPGCDGRKAILLSTHDLDLAIQMGDCLWLQEKGRPMACGTPEDLIMSGAFESFFGKEGIVFDPATGKLNTEAPTSPIGVEGDFLTSYWVGNA